MGERTINFGTDATDADYQIRDSSSTGGNLVIEHLPTGATFEYDATENAWVPTDPIGTANRPVPGVVSDSVDTDEISVAPGEQYGRAFGGWIVAPDASDWGAAMNAIVSDSNFSAEDTIYVPPVPYTSSTKFTYDQRVNVVGMGAGASNAFNDQNPTIDKDADIKHVEGGQAQATFRNLNFQDTLTSSKPNLEFHTKTELYNVISEGAPSEQVYFLQSASGDNLNGSKFVGGAAGGTHGVKIENSSGNTDDVNNINVQILECLNHSTAAIEALDGKGHSLEIGIVEGSDVGIILNTNYNVAIVHYAESDVTNSVDPFGYSRVETYDDRSSNKVLVSNLSMGPCIQQGRFIFGTIDISVASPVAVGQIAVSEGANTSSGHPELAVGIDTSGDGSADSWLTMGGDTI